MISILNQIKKQIKYSGIIFGALLFTVNLQAQQQLTNLPTFYLTTENNQAVSSKTTWVPGNITVVSSDITENLNMAMTIRGRGNSTWNLAKKPYRIKLDSKTRLLNLPAKEKNWVLLANHADKTLIRNAVAFEVGRLVGFEFTPSVRFVDVYLNGVYQGNYMLTDQVQRGDNRVNIDKLEAPDTNLPVMSGGYLLEIDGFAESEAVWFTTPKSLKVTIKEPDDDDIQPEQISYIQSFTNNYENLLFSSNYADASSGYRSMVDTTSLINWYIASELTGNPDCFWSTYIYKKRNIDKFFYGPMWDYDIAFNNDHRLGDAVHSLMRDKAFNPRAWMQRYWQDDWFKLSVNRRWQELLNDGILDKLLTYIDAVVTEINASQKQNYTKWKVINTKVYHEQFLFPTYEDGVNYLKNYLTERVSFLTESFADSQPEIPTPPFVAEGFYYNITNRGSNNLIDVTNNSTEQQAELMLWSAEREDYAQQWEIKSIGNDAFQIINRNSGLAMTGNGRANNLKQTTVNANNTAQQWKIIPLFTGDIYGLENVGSGYSVNNSGGGKANGTAVIEYDNNMFNESKINQHWYIQKVDQIVTAMAQQLADNSSIRIYPNPAKDFIRIELTEQSNLPVNIYRLDGQCVYTGKLNGKKHLEIQLDNLNLSQGIYFVKVGTYTSKIIINTNR